MYPLSQTFGYAVLALACLARCCQGLVQGPDIATCAGVPLPYLRKLLTSLTESGLVRSRRGRDGGFELAQEAAAISLWEIASVVDPTLTEQRCLMGLSRCSDEHACPVHPFWKVERGRIEERLRAVSLDDVASFGWTPGVLGPLPSKSAGAAAGDRDETQVAAAKAASERTRDRRAP